MSDIKIAWEQVAVGTLSLIFVRDGAVIYRSNQTGLRPLVEAIQTQGRSLEGASMADKVVGRAAALLAIHAKICSLYASTISLDAGKILTKYTIPYSCGRTVAQILNRNGTGVCPFEKAVSDTEDPAEAFRRVSKIINP